MKNGKRFGVGLSGGGYRAAAFHLGTLKKLNELNVLEDIDVLSTISGGSITGAAYSLHIGMFNDFEEKMVKTLSTKSVIRYVLTSRTFLLAIGFCLLFLVSAIWLLFTQFAPFSILCLLLFFVLLIKYQFRIFPVSDTIEKAYNHFFYDGAKLQDLSSRTELAIGSTNLQTCRPFTFSKRKMEDSAYAYPDEEEDKKPIKFNGAEFPVARAVMASSCVPFAFTPISIDKVFFEDYEEAVKQGVNPKLVDGGVFDNQGVQKLTQDGSSYACEVVLISDAGNKLPFDESYNNTFTLLLRTVNTFMARIKNFQMASNIFHVPLKREVAYQSLGWDIDKCVVGFWRNLKGKKISEAVMKFHGLRDEWVKSPAIFKDEILQHMKNRSHYAEIKKRELSEPQLQQIREVGTNLTALSEVVVRSLIRHAADITEMQVRLYCPTLME